MERGSDKHGFRLDDQMAGEVQGMIRGGHSTHAEEWKDPEPSGEDQPEVDRAPHETLEGGVPDGMSAADVQGRSEIAIALGKEIYPATGAQLVEKAVSNDAPDRVLDSLRRLDQQQTFINVSDVWSALGGGVEEHRFREEASSATPPRGGAAMATPGEGEGAGLGTTGIEDAAGSRVDSDSGSDSVSDTDRGSESDEVGRSPKVVAGVALAAGAAVAGAVAGVFGGSDDNEDQDAGRDVIEILTTDHNEVSEMLAEIRTLDDPERRRDLADIIITELVRHSVAEEMYVYPAMKKHLPDGDAAVEHDTAEHKEIERTLKDLEGADPADARFMAFIGQLETILQDHIQDEERDQFPQLRARVPRDELVQIGAKVQTAKKLAPTRPHPSAPNSAPFHKLVGPGVGLVDRLRDKMSGRATG